MTLSKSESTHSRSGEGPRFDRTEPSFSTLATLEEYEDEPDWDESIRAFISRARSSMSCFINATQTMIGMSISLVSSMHGKINVKTTRQISFTYLPVKDALWPVGPWEVAVFSGSLEGWQWQSDA